MCGRFSILNSEQSLAKHFELIEEGEFKDNYNVCPGTDIPIIRLNAQGDRIVSLAHWGFIPSWAKDDKLQPINAKAETIASKPFFRGAFRHHRCLIPASGYYEWKGKAGSKQPYYLQSPDSDWLAFAGIWDQWDTPDQSIESCSIITTDATPQIESIHHRMPVILQERQYQSWLEEGGLNLLKPYPAELTFHQVSTRVNKPGNNGPDLIEPIE